MIPAEENWSHFMFSNLQKQLQVLFFLTALNQEKNKSQGKVDNTAEES